MSHLLFMDESGHDHRNLPYEVRGGITLEIKAFGGLLHQYGKELKGHKLFDKDRFKWANQAEWMDEEERKKACLVFLNRGLKRVASQKRIYCVWPGLFGNGKRYFQAVA